MNDSTTSLGARIRLARERQGLVQSALAEALQTNASLVSKWERDEVTPRISTLAKIAKALKVHLEWLREGEGERNLPASLLEARVALQKATMELDAFKEFAKLGAKTQDDQERLAKMEILNKANLQRLQAEYHNLQQREEIDLRKQSEFYDKFGLFEDYINNIIQDTGIKISESKIEMILNRIIYDFRTTGLPPQKETIEFYLALGSHEQMD